MRLSEALDAAKQQKQHINHFSEYANSYVFSFDDGIESYGGDSPIVVPKNGGPCVSFVHAPTDTDYLDGGIVAEGAV